MGFQLVRASDDEIIVWHTEHGHIFTFQVVPEDGALNAGPYKDVAEAIRDAASLRVEAQAFATEEARKRQLIA